MLADGFAVHLAVRTLHVLAAAALVGGAFVPAAVRPGTYGATTFLGAATAYERLAAAALAVLVATGIGNVGALGTALPDAGERWGAIFTAKLGLVLTLAAISVARVLMLTLLSERGASAHLGRLRAMYGATAVTGVVVVALAEMLAHG